MSLMFTDDVEVYGEYCSIHKLKVESIAAVTVVGCTEDCITNQRKAGTGTALMTITSHL